MVKQGSKVLITGGAGFIGSHAARAVVAAGGMVRILDDFSTGSRDRLIGMPRLDLIQGDVRNPATVLRAVKGADAVLHLASLPPGGDSSRAQQVNLGGTLNILEAVRQMEKRERPRVVLCSSGAVYGKQNAFVLHEELAPRPGTADAVTSLAVEHYGRVYRELHGVPATCMRLFRTFGPGEDADRAEASVVAKFVRAALDGTSPVIFGDGQQTRDLIYVDNVVNAMRSALTADPDIYNIASGEAVQINFLWTLVLELTGKRRRAIEPTYVPAPAWDPLHARPQIGKACKSLSWAPSVRLRDGLARTVHHYQAERNTDPNAWFTPRDASPTPRMVTPPAPPLQSQSGSRERPAMRRMPEMLEVADEDLVEEPQEKELDIEWAPVPAVPGFSR
jgi:nucleoside-diphosphate-sugar epimerase